MLVMRGDYFVINLQNFYYLLDRNRIQSGPAILCVHVRTRASEVAAQAKYTLFARQAQGLANF